MPLVPSYIKKLSSYKPGKPIEEVKRDLGLKNIIKLDYKTINLNNLSNDKL